MTFRLRSLVSKMITLNRIQPNSLLKYVRAPLFLTPRWNSCLIKWTLQNQMCETGWQIQRYMHFYASKFQNFPSILFIKIMFQGVLNAGSQRKIGEWRKENANATNVESQTFQNETILTSQPCCYPFHLKTLRMILTVKLNMFNFISWYFLFFDDLKYLFLSSYIYIFWLNFTIFLSLKS